MRRRMAQAGFDVAAGDTWAVNEFPSTVRSGSGTARENARELVRGLYEGDRARAPTRGAVFIVGLGQGTTNVSVYQTNLQNWLADLAFWTDMSTYVSDWSQEVYGDFRRYAVPGAPITLRRDYLNDYLQHALVLARAGPPTIELARGFLQTAFSPVANAAWQYESGYGWTMVPFDQMQAFVSAQVYALRSASVAAGPGAGSLGLRLAAAERQRALRGRLHVSDGSDPRPARRGDPRLRPGRSERPRQRRLRPAGTERLLRRRPHGRGVQRDMEGAPRVVGLRARLRDAAADPRRRPAVGADQPGAADELGRAGRPRRRRSPSLLTSGSPEGRFSLSPGGPWASADLNVTIPAGGAATPPFYYLDTRAATAADPRDGHRGDDGDADRDGGARALSRLTVDPGSAAIGPRGSRRFARGRRGRFRKPAHRSPDVDRQADRASRS